MGEVGPCEEAEPWVERSALSARMRALERENIQLSTRVEMLTDELERLTKEKEVAFENGFCRGFAAGSDR